MSLKSDRSVATPFVSQNCRAFVEQNRLVKKALPYVVQTKKNNVEQIRAG
jgi:hypothetical protein